MESVGPRRRGHETLAFPAKSLEITLAKTPEIRARLLEMAMPALQRKRLERLDLHRMRMGMEAPQEAPQNLPTRNPTGTSRRDNAEEQLVPDGADEKSRGCSSTNRGSSSGVSKTRPSSGETSTSEEGCGRTKKDAHSGTAKNAGDNARTGAGEHRGRTSRKKKVGSATGTALDVAMLLGLLTPRMGSLSLHAKGIAFPPTA